MSPLATVSDPASDVCAVVSVLSVAVPALSPDGAADCPQPARVAAMSTVLIEKAATFFIVLFFILNPFLPFGFKNDYLYHFHAHYNFWIFFKEWNSFTFVSTFFTSLTEIL
jgi:hypothetical protein